MTDHTGLWAVSEFAAVHWLSWTFCIYKAMVPRSQHATTYFCSFLIYASSSCFISPHALVHQIPSCIFGWKLGLFPAMGCSTAPQAFAPGVTEAAWWLTRGFPLTSCWVLALAIWCDFWGAAIIWDISSLMWYPHTLHGASWHLWSGPYTTSSLKPWLGRALRFSWTAAAGILSNIHHWEVDP